MADIESLTRHPRRYLVVGVVCAAVHNGIMFGMDRLGAHYVASLVLSFAVLAPLGYFLHSIYTFAREVQPIRFVRFATGLLAGFPINLVLMVLFVSVLGLGVPLATFVCTALLFIWNFASARWAILLHR